MTAPTPGTGAGHGRRGDRDGKATAVAGALRGRVAPTRVLLGLGLVLVMALAGVVVAARVDTRVPVLVVARPVAAGQALVPADVSTVRVAVDPGLATVPAGRRSAVVGRVAAVPLLAGTLLSPYQLGAVVWPPAGQAVVAVAVQPGRVPAGLPAGARVMVLVVPGPNTAGGVEPAGGGEVRATAVVVSLQPAPDGSTVATLLLPAEAATGVVTATGDVALVQLGG